jgi:hypothetical protein
MKNFINLFTHQKIFKSSAHDDTDISNDLEVFEESNKISSQKIEKIEKTQEKKPKLMELDLSEEYKFIEIEDESGEDAGEDEDNKKNKKIRTIGNYII